MGGMNTLPDLFERWDRLGERPAVMADREDGFETWTYRSLADHARRLARGLVAIGVRAEEPVAILASNRPEWIVAYFGIVAADATAMPLDAMAKDVEIEAMLAKSGCRRLFTTRDRLARLPPGWGEAEGRVYLLDGDPSGSGNGSGPKVQSWRSLLAASAGALPAIRPDRRASLLFTSGTTGTPKAVPLTHANFVADLESLLAAGIVAAGDRLLLPLPLHHAYPFTVGMLGSLASGAILLLPAGLTGPQILHAARAGRAAIIVGVPGLYGALLGAIETRVARGGATTAWLFRRLWRISIWLRRHLRLRIGRLLFHRIHAEFGGALRVLSSGGAKLDLDVAWRLEGLGWQVLSGYGLTETSPILTFNPPGEARLDTEGRAIAGIELRVEAAPDGGPGAILARGASVFAGYLDDPAANEEAFTKDGWFQTGDLGFLDAAGYLHVIGRANETITLPSGKKIFPDDIEAAYAQMPFVKEMAVLLADNALVALVVPEPEALRERGAARVEGLLREHIERRAALLKPQERVVGYAFTLEPLPRTHLGKLKRHQLAAIYARARAGAAAPGPQPEALSAEDRQLVESAASRPVWEWLRARYPGRSLTLDTSPQLDLGIDSLQWIELTAEIEDRFQLRLDEAAIARVLTLRDLLREMARAPAAAELERTAAGALAVPTDFLAEPGLGWRCFSLVLYAALILLIRALFRLEVRGRENIPAEGAVVFTPNHASYLDSLVLAATFSWRDLRRTHWAGWAALLFANPVMRAVSRAGNVLPVDPDREPARALAQGAAALRQGRRLVWFPEGRISPTGEINPFLPGVGVLLQETGARAVPVRLVGTFEALPRHRRWPRPGRLRVVFGAAATAAELAAGVEGKDAPARIVQGLHDRVAALPET
jgi:long-chain acyl-CoA synthetase